jgi:hypothetical protein
LRDIVTVDYPAGNKNTVPMVNFAASAAVDPVEGSAEKR